MASPVHPGNSDWTMCADKLRHQAQQIPKLDETIATLSRWFDALRAPPYDDQNADERLGAAFGSGTDHPAAWCARVSADLPPELAIPLSDSIGSAAPFETLNSLVNYIFGRACMRSVMATPSDTSGLSLAYNLLWPMAYRNGGAYAGADDELLAQLDTATDARAEVEAEAQRLKQNPVLAAGTLDLDRTRGAIQQASSPKSLETCANWQVRQLPIRLKFGRVVQVIGLSDAAFAIKLLETINNPALVASALSYSGVSDIPAMAHLLNRADQVFDKDNRWTRGTTAWMVLLEIEQRLLTLLEEQIRAVRLGAPVPPDPEAIIRRQLDAAAEAVLSRSDGPRLVLEWLAHLLWSILIMRAPLPGTDIDDLSSLDPRRVLLNAAGACFTRADWANPIRIWALFDGSLLVAGANDSYRLVKEVPLRLPMWHDWLEQENTIVPAALAVLFPGDRASSLSWLASWVRLICQNLQGLSVVHQLTEPGPSQAARHLAWPLARTGRPSERFAELWSDAGWQLTRARFSKLEDAASTVRPCVALVRIGLYMLEWSKLFNNDDVRALASLLADAIDEMRYTLHDPVGDQWPTLAGKLAGVMAATGLLKDGGCERLLARYEGDDDALAAASVNMAANGVPSWQVRQALASIGVDAHELADRWEGWNRRVARDRSGKPTDFLKCLQSISEAVT
jgi:hypothetical protein